MGFRSVRIREAKTDSRRMILPVASSRMVDYRASRVTNTSAGSIILIWGVTGRVRGCWKLEANN